MIGIRVTGRPVFCAAVVAALSWTFIASSADAAARDCTTAEKEIADAQLMSIQYDEERRDSIFRRHLPFGVHAGSHIKQDRSESRDLLAQEGYVLLHDGDFRTAMWVAYRLTSEDVAGAEGQDRVNCFRGDPRLSADKAAKGSDYDEPIFDRGHMANDADLKDDLVEQLNTYVLSNVSPQHCRFNRGIWLSLEELGRSWAVVYGRIYVTSGAVFADSLPVARGGDLRISRMGSRNKEARVAIPTGYYKVFARQIGTVWHSIAFMLEHDNSPHGVRWSDVVPHVRASIVSLKDIETEIEMIFFPGIERQSLVESKDGAGWELRNGGRNFESSC